MLNDKPCLDCGQARRPKEGARGLCKSCYYKRRRRGTLGEVSKQKHSFQEYIDMVVPDDNGCWPWPGYVDDNGYGNSSSHGGAHVESYRRHVGPVPDGLDVGHLCHDRDVQCGGGATCRHRRCVNPTHLGPQTRSENLAAKPPKRVCKRGHDLSPENVYVIPQTGGRQCRKCTRLLKAERAQKLLHTR